MEATLKANQADQHPEQFQAHFTLQAEVEPSVLPRVLEPFALRNLTPEAVSSRREQGRMRIDVTVRGLDVREVEHLTLRLNQVVPVHTVFASRLPADAGDAVRDLPAA